MLRRIWLAGVLAVAVLATGVVRAEEKPPQTRFEVLVLGTYHAPGMFLSDGYTPGHIRATLAAAKPDVVAVESHPEWFAKGRYHVVTYEAEGVAVPWAREQGIPVHGVDWKDIEAWDRMEEANALSEAGRLRRALAGGSIHPSLFGRLPDGSREWARNRLAESAKIDWEHLNGVHDDSWARSRWGGKSPEQEDFVGRRDRGIAANAVAVMRDHPGKRLVIVVGAHHKPFLDHRFGRMEGVRVLTLGRDVPVPSQKEIEAAWTSDDLVNALGHTLDAGSAYFHADLVDLPRARRLLAMLEKRRDRADVARYFRARIHVHAGEPKKAERELDALRRRKPRGTLYPFPLRQWRMRFSLAEAVALEKGRLLLDRGKDDEARKLLEPLAAAFESRRAALEAKPGVRRRVETIKDSGFEAGERASDFFDGWGVYIPAGGGMLRFEGDETVKTEGERSLRLLVTESGSRPFTVRQEVTVPLGEQPISRVAFGLSLRGEGVGQATLTVWPAWSATDRSTLAEETVNLEPGRWTRGDVAFDLPTTRKFALTVSFRGSKGAKLWLDGGTPLPVSYVTVPAEWNRLARAHAYLRWLLAGRPEPGARSATPAAIAPGLKDAGFESGTLAPSPLAGWFSADVGSGVLRVVTDTEAKVEGKQALRLEVLLVKAGSPVNMSQTCDLPEGAEFEFSLRLRANGVSWTHVNVGIWEDDRTFRPLGSHHGRETGRDWVHATIRFEPPKDKRRLGIFILFPGKVGARVWVDAASLKRVR